MSGSAPEEPQGLFRVLRLEPENNLKIFFMSASMLKGGGVMTLADCVNSSPSLIARKFRGFSVEFGRFRGNSGNFGKIQGNSVEFSGVLYGA